MAGTSNYPGSLDDFAEASPTNLGDDDSTGRNHAERHDDMEAAMEAVQAELGTDPAGSESTVADRLANLASDLSGKGPTGGSTDQVFYENDATVTTDYSITATRNAVTAGPLEISSGITVTVPVGSAWTIV